MAGEGKGSSTPTPHPPLRRAKERKGGGIGSCLQLLLLLPWLETSVGLRWRCISESHHRHGHRRHRNYFIVSRRWHRFQHQHHHRQSSGRGSRGSKAAEAVEASESTARATGSDAMDDMALYDMVWCGAISRSRLTGDEKGSSPNMAAGHRIALRTITGRGWDAASPAAPMVHSGRVQLGKLKHGE